MTRYAIALGAFHIEPAPSQPQLAHCHGFFVMADLRGRGHGKFLKNLQMQILADLGYDYATCTVDSGNAAQITILDKAGWQKLAEFTNRKTGGTTQLWGWEVQ